MQEEYRSFNLICHCPPLFYDDDKRLLNHWAVVAKNRYYLHPDLKLHSSTGNYPEWPGWFPTLEDAKAVIDGFWDSISAIKE